MKAKTGYIGGGHEPIMLAPRFAGLKQWAAELTLAEQVVQRFGGELKPTAAAHQVAKLTGPGFRLVLYPHKTTAGHYHMRVRDEHSRDPKLAATVMRALDDAAGPNCTFSRKLCLKPTGEQP